MNLSTATVIAWVAPLILIEGFFSGSEIALFSADRLLLKTQASKGSRRAQMALELVTHPERVLSTTLLMTNLCVIGISALIALYCLGRALPHADLIAVAVASPLIVLIGELIPKTVYQRYADRVAPWVSYPIYYTFLAFFPATRILSYYTGRISKLVSPIEEIITGRKRNTREELRSLLSYGKRETEIKTSEKRMIKRIFDFKDTEAKHALIPLVKVEAIDESSSIHDALERFQRHRHSRMPVYSSRVDNIIGVLEAFDLLHVTDLRQTIRNYVAPARYVAETQALEDVLVEMRQNDEQMVVIVDEYGGAVGILTFEDIIEEIVGEISDEYDPQQAAYKELSPDTWAVQARTEVHQLNEQLRIEIPEGDYETLGGFLLQQFGRIPEPKDELFFDTSSGMYKFTIRKATDRQIETVLIEKLHGNEKSDRDPDSA